MTDLGSEWHAQYELTMRPSRASRWGFRRGFETLRYLVEQITPEAGMGEIDWGGPAGKEVW
jgi:antitoxin component of MazEF toxin-antitoxin module